MSFFSNIIKSIEHVATNVVKTVANPINTIKNAVFLGPISAQAGAAVYGPKATPKQAVIATAVGAAAVAAGGLAGPTAGAGSGTAAYAGPDLAAGTTYGTVGSTVGASSIIPAGAGIAANSSLFDSFANSLGLGKALSYISNPGAADAPASTPSTNTNAASTPTSGMNWWLIGGIGFILVIAWLLMRKS